MEQETRGGEKIQLAYSLITIEQTKSPISEAYRTLRTNVQFTDVDSETKKIMITSSGPREGKSSTVANLAVSMAQTGKCVLVVDADLRNPTQHKLFGLDNRQGLSVALVQEQDYRNYIRETAVPGVKVLTGGPIPPNPAELVGSNRMKRLIKEFSEEYDIVLIDTPPVIAVTDAAVLAQEVDGVILVLASGEVNKDYALRAKELLDKVGAKILGAVLNKADLKTGEYNYYYYYHGSDDSNKKKQKRQKDR
ncbi:capsular exopolysaccharide family [Desulfosporosinus lacus DSM 15449]|uniref:non-specific protein-tyrosine kinase n=1 Tax=Desulfosporosinus lacus DSM 15449 TaxID=1121420 RepID=A0A1M5RDT7_9FIRM|nr:capsular exopolysaccharide family [Desulfosporosinus lacus DSM 15449]